MADINTNTPKDIKLRSNIEVAYTKDDKQKFYAKADGFPKVILFDPPARSEEGRWIISFRYKKGGKMLHENGVISDDDKRLIDEVDIRKRSSVILKPPKKGVRVVKLVTHTNIGDRYFSPKCAQQILIENSVFCCKAEIFVPYSQASGPYEAGDFHVETRELAFSLIPRDKKTDEENETGADETSKDEQKIWKIQYSYYNKDKKEYGYGEISDNNSQSAIVTAINEACKKIKRQTLKVCELDNDKSRISLVSFPGYHKDSKDDKKSIVYSVTSFGEGDYCIMTGLFCGIIKFGKEFPPLEIRTEYTDTLVLRMIDRCCGIYVSSNPDFGSEGRIDSNLYSKIIQYMYLLSLRKVISILVPKRYAYLRDRGYEIRGNIDIERYINHDIIAKDKKLSFIYPERHEIQSIIDVMYAALKSCTVSGGSFLPNLKSFEEYLGSVYSGRHPSGSTIKNAGKEKVLRNGLYSSFKRPLELAKMLLENEEISDGDLETKNGISALLMDSSYLWETYLESVMRNGLEDWDIAVQHENDILYYPNCFYSKTNRPDFILTNKNTSEVFILDAKFKHMDFDSKDVDNDDLQQLHCYSYYYFLTHGNKFRGTALIYPTRSDQSVITKKYYDKMFGTEYAKYMDNFNQKFGVITLKDADKLEASVALPPDTETKDLTETMNLDFNEEAFIARLKTFLETEESV